MNKPNILFIYTDEQAVNTLAAYGNNQIEMPALNRLSSQSTVFENAYVTQPVCTPSRSSLVTGLYPHTNGCIENNIPLRAETKCLPEMLSDKSYVSAHFGKWHLGDELFSQHGFDNWAGIEDAYNNYFSEGKDRNTFSHYHNFLIDRGYKPQTGKHFRRKEAAGLPEEVSKPAFLAEKAEEFITENKDKPFILYINFLEPHMPFTGPRDTQYDPAEMPLPENFEDSLSDAQPLKTRLFAETYFKRGYEGQALQTKEDWQSLISRYWGLCSQIDTYIGKVLDCLESHGLTDNTVIVFTSDHGDMMGSHRLLAKCVMFEESVKVPLFIKLPGQKEGRRVSGPVSQVDLVPTLLDLLGEDVPAYLQGKSLAPLLAGDNRESSDNVFIEWNGCDSGLFGGKDLNKDQVPVNLSGYSSEELSAAVKDHVRSVITPEGWKFNYSQLGEHELYSLIDDPLEKNNLTGDNLYDEIKNNLAGLIIEWQKKTDDQVVLPSLED
ncbi:MAG: sulfatase-like hydrolase/transferase [Planctomycetota bacterium]|jgi:arylsulfatase A-like enzyme